MTIGETILSAGAKGQGRGLDRLDVELLLCRTLNRERMYLYTCWDKELAPARIKQFQGLLKERKKGVPLAYILKQKEFYGHKFWVTPGVFIPRPETETLISAVLSQVSPKEKLNILDLGCGTGCVGLSLLAHLPRACLALVDLSKKAVRASQINAREMGLEKRTFFFQKEVSRLCLGDFADIFPNGIDLITANPPYIAFDDPRVEKQVVLFEPAQALFSGQGGLYHLHSWLKRAGSLLKAGGFAFFEIGAGQEGFFSERGVSEQGFSKQGVSKQDVMRKKNQFRDLSGCVRVLQFQKENNG